jgi:hypothetical protein
MSASDFLAFGTASNALSNSAWVAAVPSGGFGSGLLTSPRLNKAIRQPSVMAAAWGAFLVSQGQNASDSGVVSDLTTEITAALVSFIQSTVIAQALPYPKAWVNFNGSTAAIASSYGVSSVTHIGTGIYTVTFSSTLNNGLYAVSGSTLGTSGSAPPGPYVYSTDGLTPVLKTTTAVQVATIGGSGPVDSANVSVVIHGT